MRWWVGGRLKECDCVVNVCVETKRSFFSSVLPFGPHQSRTTTDCLFLRAVRVNGVDKGIVWEINYFHYFLGYFCS